jgi:hypothetical protein
VTLGDDWWVLYRHILTNISTLSLHFIANPYNDDDEADVLIQQTKFTRRSVLQKKAIFHATQTFFFQTMSKLSIILATTGMSTS